MKNLICFALIGLVFCVVLALIDNSAVAGNTYHVPDDYSTIQAAIDAASNGDTVLVADGTYTGSDNKDLDFDGKAITVKSENGPENCIIDCQDDGRAFYFHNDETNDSIVEGFTIKNGDTGIYYGAGIYCYDGASPTITNCIFEDNSTRRGGAIACKKNSSPTISNCIMKNNWALYGGGVWLYDDSDAIIKDCVITNNTADNNGGGIQSYDSNPTITNCLIADNEAISPGVGGGVYFYEGSVGTLTNCTIANNDGRYGGGVSAKDQGTTMTLNNTIIWGNHASTYGHQIRAYGYGAVVLNYCDYANGDNDVNTSSQGTVTPSNCINSDPDFVDDANGDYHLDTGSPCIDAGSNTLVPAGVEFDLAGNWRRPKSKCYRFVATISPSSIFDKTKDIPKLDGARTRPLPGADSGANKRWDISRRKREKILNPAPTTIVRNDYWAAAGDQKDNLDAKAAQFPIASIKLYEYPTDELEGNDDSGTTDEDNNPYSDAEGLPDNPSFKANKGQVASTDRVRSPYIREAAGNLNETVEDRTQFGEFVRLQIGDSSTAGYKNWYYISSHNNSKFLDWQAIIKFKRAAAGMIDNGSDVAINNNGW